MRDHGSHSRDREAIPVVPVFDGFRGLAAMAIVLYHVLFVTRALGTAGTSWLAVVMHGLLPRGLDVLFVVSGFVIYLPTAVTGTFGSVPAFFARRMARLLPAYWVALALAAGLTVLLGSDADIPDAGTAAVHLAMAQAPALLFLDRFPLGFGVIAPVWTLSIEVAFYLTLPLVAAWYFRRPGAGLLAAAVVVVAWRALAGNAPAMAAWLGLQLTSAAEHRIDVYYASQPPQWALALAAGMTGARVYAVLRSRAARPRDAIVIRAVLATAMAAFAALVCLAGLDAVRDSSAGVFARESVLVLLGVPIVLAAGMVAIALGPEAMQRPFTTFALRRLGDVSYGIYLMHFAVIWAALRTIPLPREGRIEDVVAWCALVVPASIAYGSLSARFVERPVRHWARQFGRRAALPVEAEAAV